jgi:hypothetical protein
MSHPPIAARHKWESEPARLVTATDLGRSGKASRTTDDSSRRIEFSNGSRAEVFFRACRRFRVSTFSACSFGTDGVSWAQSGSVEIAVGLRSSTASPWRKLVAAAPSREMSSTIALVLALPSACSHRRGNGLQSVRWTRPSGERPPIAGRDEAEQCARKRSEAERVGCAMTDRSGRKLRPRQFDPARNIRPEQSPCSGPRASAPLRLRSGSKIGRVIVYSLRAAVGRASLARRPGSLMCTRGC